ncbi:transporter substrate-binding domain-containing protein [Acidisphaera sp. L21]|uniref:transporter substrate-binding domain-containing protein n=1 Tax=Acidisphaera sp. L21 TaxID=1641851 RepID=UPI00131D391D|nr:transporter substrate-binding domain-containing protein [Acidisphaera sp. L21]
MLIGRRILLAGSASLAAGLAVTTAKAETVQDIQKRGTLRLGVLGDQPPWGFLDGDGKSAGYDVDFGVLMAKAMGVKPEFVTMTVAARIAQLMTNKVDLVIAVMGMYPERAKVVQFTKPYAALSIIVLGHKSQKVGSVADLAKLRIGVPRGAAQDTALTAQVPGGDIRRYDDDASNIQALLAGQVDVIGGNTTYILNINKALPNNDIEQKLVLNRQYMGIAMRPGQKELNEWLNAFVDKVRDGGDLEKLSQKWIGQPLPELPASLEGVPFTVS